MSNPMAGDGSQATERQETVGALRRRKALQDFIRANDLEPAAWARQAGLRSANAIYNFLNGRSSSLNSETYERLARAVPGTTVAQLVGEKSSHRPALSHTIRIREAAAAGVWRLSPELPEDEQEGASIPEGAMRAQGAFGVRLEGNDMDLDWPKSTLFVVTPLLMTDGVKDNNLVLVRRTSRDRKFETTIREIRRDTVDPKRAWLWPRSSKPEYQTPIPCPWPVEGAFDDAGDKLEVTGVAIGAYLRLDQERR